MMFDPQVLLRAKRAKQEVRAFKAQRDADGFTILHVSDIGAIDTPAPRFPQPTTDTSQEDQMI